MKPPSKPWWIKSAPPSTTKKPPERFSQEPRAHSGETKFPQSAIITTRALRLWFLHHTARIDSKMVLIDGRVLCHLMIDYDIGISRTAVYEIKKIDHDYFDEENG